MNQFIHESRSHDASAVLISAKGLTSVETTERRILGMSDVETCFVTHGYGVAVACWQGGKGGPLPPHLAIFRGCKHD